MNQAKSQPNPKPEQSLASQKSSSSAIEITRKHFATLSIDLVSKRLSKQKAINSKYTSLEIQDIYDKRAEPFNNFQSLCSQYGDESSVSKGKFFKTSTDKQSLHYCTIGASGHGLVWKINIEQENVDEHQNEFCVQFTQLEQKQPAKLYGLAIHPLIGQIPEYAPNLITGTYDGKINLWTFSKNLKKQKSISIQAHSDRVNSILFQKSGKYMISSSYDKSWSLWDFSTLNEVYKQKGHQGQIYTTSIHPDNSLLFTGDLNGAGMVWDLRTNRGIYEVTDSGSILCSDFNPNGYELAFAGKTNIITIKDLRQRKTLKQIPAHLKLISDLKYSQNTSTSGQQGNLGSVLVSGSHDNTIKIWHGLHYGQITEQGEELQLPSKISSIDLHDNLLAGTTIDRKFTIWKQKNNPTQREKMEQE